jgi:hypothetical protein
VNIANIAECCYGRQTACLQARNRDREPGGWGMRCVTGLKKGRQGEGETRTGG